MRKLRINRVYLECYFTPAVRWMPKVGRSSYSSKLHSGTGFTLRWLTAYLIVHWLTVKHPAK